MIAEGWRELALLRAQILHGDSSNGAGSAEGSRCRANVCVGVEGVYEHNK